MNKINDFNNVARFTTHLFLQKKLLVNHHKDSRFFSLTPFVLVIFFLNFAKNDI